jgi:hypothetical protein
MHAKRLIKWFAIAVIFPFVAQGQGSFQNLDLEAATIPQDEAPGAVNVADALPGWSVSYNYGPSGQFQQPQTSIGFNGYNDPWNAQVILLGTNGINGGVSSLEGGYSVLLRPFLIPGYQLNNVSIAQDGVVPASAQSLFFEAQPGLEALLLSVGGQNVPFSAVATGPNYTLFGADISSFASQSVELRFAVLAPVLSPSGWNLDSIEFSTQQVPEPSALALVAGLAGFLFICRREILAPKC